MNFSKRTYALISGISLLIMALTAGYSYGYVHNSLVVAENPAATLNNLRSSLPMFGSGIIGWLIILATDLLVSWSLYNFFATVNPRISFATGVVRVVYSVVLAFAIYHLGTAWKMLQIGLPDASELMDLLDAFEKYWSLGLIVFGLHLLGLGYLSLKSNSVPKWIGWLLYIAAISYSAIHGAKVITPDAVDTIALAEMVMGIPMAVAELGLGVWLLWKGGRKKTSHINIGRRTSSLLNVSVGIMILSVLLTSCTKELVYFPGSVEEEVEKIIDQGFVGTIVYVNQSGKSAFYSAGWKNRENQIPADPHSLFKIGSISKLYIAAATTKLVADKSLSLDNTLSQLLPDFANGIEYADQITLKMLLAHRSGIPDYIDHPDYPWTSPFKENSDTYSLVFGQAADFKPGKKQRYSNTNYLLIGEILDRTLGYSHHEYIKDKILTPLELNNTYNLLKDTDLDHVMSGYFAGYEHDIKYNDFIQPGGSMVATAEDVGIFLRALIDGTLFNPQEQAIYSSVYEYEHTGLLPGYQSIARYHETMDAVVIQFVNTSAEGLRYWNTFEKGYNRIIRALKKECL